MKLSMLPKTSESLTQWQSTARRRLLCLAVISLCTLELTSRALAQQRNDSAPKASDLAMQNLSRVAASAAEIKAVLIKDAGLMVELKRWVAKDATDHGQIVGETELSDYAIFDRLGTDVEFRSIATTLVQRYGYLLPKLNPESDLAKEQELLRVERTKWMAQAQEEERAQARQRSIQEAQKSAACDPQSGRACNNTPSSVPPKENPGQGQQIDAPPPGITPGDQNLPSLPDEGATILQRAQLMQTGSGNVDGSPQNAQFSLASSSGSNPFSLGNPGIGTLSSDTGEAGKNRQLAAAFGGANPGIGNSSDGLLARDGPSMIFLIAPIEILYLLPWLRCRKVALTTRKWQAS